MSQIDVYTIQKPKKNENKSGDIVLVDETNEKVFIALIDVAGHGDEAYEIALKCKDYIEQKYNNDSDLIKLMEELHQFLKSIPNQKFKRGAVGVLCNFYKKEGTGELVAVGDPSIYGFGSMDLKIIPRPGVIGYQMRSLKKKEIRLKSGDVLVFHTDGIKECLSTEPLKSNDKTARELAEYIMNNYRRYEDDASCVVLKYYQ